MVRVGHALLGKTGELLSADAGFCDILETPADSLVGRNVLDVTVPADRPTCRTLMRNLQATREPFRVAKRFIKADGAEIWVTNTVSIVALGDAPAMVVSTIIPIGAPASQCSPAQMLDCARLLMASRHKRRTAFATTIFADPAWDMMLAAYVAEAEGGVLDLDMLARTATMPKASVTRWVNALRQEGLVEIEARQGDAAAERLFRLTPEAHRQFEIYLAELVGQGRSEPEQA